MAFCPGRLSKIPLTDEGLKVRRGASRYPGRYLPEVTSELLGTQDFGFPPIIFSIHKHMQPPGFLFEGICEESIRWSEFELCEQLIGCAIRQRNLTENKMWLCTVENQASLAAAASKYQSRMVSADVIEQRCPTLRRNTDDQGFFPLHV